MSNRKPGLCDSLRMELGGGLGHLPSGSPGVLCCPAGCKLEEAPPGPETAFLAQRPWMALLSWQCPCMPAASTQAGSCGSSHSTQLGSLPSLACPVFPPRCSQAFLLPGHPQCSVFSALALLSRGRGGLCPRSQRSLYSPEQQLCGSLGGPAWFRRLLSVEGG